MGIPIKFMIPALILFLIISPAAGATAVQEVKVTVPESVEIMVLWQGREAGNSFTLTATVEPGKEYHWPGGPQGLQIKDLSNVPIDLYKGLKETSRAQKPYPYKTSNTPTTASDSPKHH